MRKRNELKFSIGREERSLILIANFIDGYTSDFVFNLPESFRDALDIKKISKIIFGESKNLYTQGRNFCFKEGDVIYDSKKAYSLKWGDALKHIKYSIQIIASREATVAVSETYTNLDELVELKQSKNNIDIIVKKDLIITKYKFDTGYVKFNLYKTNDNKTKLEIQNTYECSQENFIVFLQTGILRTNDRNTFKLI